MHHQSTRCTTRVHGAPLEYSLHHWSTRCTTGVHGAPPEYTVHQRSTQCTTGVLCTSLEQVIREHYSHFETVLLALQYALEGLGVGYGQCWSYRPTTGCSYRRHILCSQIVQPFPLLWSKLYWRCNSFPGKCLEQTRILGFISASVKHEYLALSQPHLSNTNTWLSLSLT